MHPQYSPQNKKDIFMLEMSETNADLMFEN